MGDEETPKTKDIARRPGEMVKPGEIIGIPGMEEWTLADRRTWNLLLMNAWSDRLEDPAAEFTISLSELRGLHDSNDRLKQSLKTLQTTLVVARLPNGKIRTVQMLGGTDLDDSDRARGVLVYEFSKKLVPLLRDSEIYARMEVKVLSSFTSKYALSLYEAVAARINLRRTTEEIDIDMLRSWLGVEKKKLNRWPDLHRFAVQVAVAEVNALSPYDVEIEPVKRGRKVASVRVSWAKKEPHSPAERAAALEANRHRAGRKARIQGTADSVVRELSENEIEQGYKAAAPICRIDKHAVYADWRSMVDGLSVKPSNPAGHFVDFCRKRAQQIA